MRQRGLGGGGAAQWFCKWKGGGGVVRQFESRKFVHEASKIMHRKLYDASHTYNLEYKLYFDWFLLQSETKYKNLVLIFSIWHT